MSFLDKIKSFFSSNTTETTASTAKSKPKTSRSNNSKASTTSSKSKDAVGELEGTVRYFNRSRGYGFIHKAVSNDKVFVHISDLNDRIKVGDNVRFNIETTEKGPRARQVTKQ